MSWTEDELITEINNVSDQHLEDVNRIKRLIFFAQGTVYTDLVNRMAIPMLYAHWEGFVYDALTLYCEFLRRERISFQDITPTLAAYSLRPLLAKVANENVFNSPTKIGRVTSDILGVASSFFDFVDRDGDIVNFGGMLNSHGVERICEWFCIEKPDLRYKELDGFVKIRTNVAHGARRYNPGPSVVRQYCDLIAECISKFRDSLAVAIRTRSYLRV